MTLKVIDPGLSTSVQDLGRIGFQQYGVVVGGVMDEMAARIANVLIGNREEDAVLEMTVIGPTLLVQQNTLLAICGADLSAQIDGVPIPLWKPIFVKEGSILHFGRPKQGCRAYLAIAGGIDVPMVMGSRSTYVRGGFGGHQGRALQEGDILKQNPLKSKDTICLMDYLSQKTSSTPFHTVHWTVSMKVKPMYHKNPAIHFIKGPQFEQFSLQSKEKFVTEHYEVTSKSDRMGYRLSGAALELTSQVELLSEAVTMGTIQVPNDGQPIILMADRQTIGGYPKIGSVASVDFPLLAQVMPGEKLTFKEITVHEAQRLLLERERAFSEFRNGLILAIWRLKDGTN